MIDLQYPISEAPRQSVKADMRPRTHNGTLVPYAATISELQKLVGTEGPSRWAAFVALGYSPDPQALRYLVHATSSADWTIRRAACIALGLQRRGGAVTHRVGELLGDPVPSVARAACSVIGALGESAYHTRIASLLSHRDEATRLTAVYTLNRLWETGDTAILLTLARSDPSGEVCSAAASVLLRHVDACSWLSLFELWINHPMARNRIRACSLTMRFGNIFSLDRIAPLRLDRDEEVRNAAERAVARLAPRPVDRIAIGNALPRRRQYIREGAGHADHRL